MTGKFNLQLAKFNYDFPSNWPRFSLHNHDNNPTLNFTEKLINVSQGKGAGNEVGDYPNPFNSYSSWSKYPVMW